MYLIIIYFSFKLLYFHSKIEESEIGEKERESEGEREKNMSCYLSCYFFIKEKVKSNGQEENKKH